MRRTSNESKQLRGTARADRMTHGPKAARPLLKAPAPPKHLSARALTEWSSLAPLTVDLGVLTTADTRALELLCETLATEAELRTVLGTEGMTVKTGAGGSKSHPALKALADARAQSMRLLEGFGLTPKGRQSIDVSPPKEKNPFDEL